MKWLNMRNWACVGGIRSVHRILVEKFSGKEHFGNLGVRLRTWC